MSHGVCARFICLRQIKLTWHNRPLNFLLLRVEGRYSSYSDLAAQCILEAVGCAAFWVKSTFLAQEKRRIVYHDAHDFVILEQIIHRLLERGCVVLSDALVVTKRLHEGLSRHLAKDWYTIGILLRPCPKKFIVAKSVDQVPCIVVHVVEMLSLKLLHVIIYTALSWLVNLWSLLLTCQLDVFLNASTFQRLDVKDEL